MDIIEKEKWATEPDDLISFGDQISASTLIKKVIPEIRVGSLCPECGIGYMNYDGCLNLCCQNCGFTSGGCFT